MQGKMINMKVKEIITLVDTKVVIYDRNGNYCWDGYGPKIPKEYYLENIKNIHPRESDVLTLIMERSII